MKGFKYNPDLSYGTVLATNFDSLREVYTKAKNTKSKGVLINNYTSAFQGNNPENLLDTYFVSSEITIKNLNKCDKEYEGKYISNWTYAVDYPVKTTKKYVSLTDPSKILDVTFTFNEDPLLDRVKFEWADECHKKSSDTKSKSK